MTEQEKHRKDFWVDRFIEQLHSDTTTQDSEYKARKAKMYADACLVQYNITFQTAKEQ